MPVGLAHFHISVVSPVYGSPNLIGELCSQLHQHVGAITQDYEIILVFDCSPDDGWLRIEAECGKDSRVKGIRLARNFGQHPAITAGLDHARGEWVVVMDCDLQDNPAEIPKLYAKAQEGYDIVVGQRLIRRDTWLKRLSSRLFYATFRFLSGIDTDNSVANFGIYHRRVIDSVSRMREPFRLFPLLVMWVGFNRAELEVMHGERASGKSGYTLRKLLELAFNVILAFSNRPLYLTTVVGFAMSFLAFGVSVLYFIMALMGMFSVTGFASLMLSIWFLSGVMILVQGMLGLYLLKAFEVVKQRPLYLVNTCHNIDARSDQGSRVPQRGVD